MRWYGKLLGLIAGALLFRPNPLFGALVGLLLGHAFDANWFGIGHSAPYRVLGVDPAASQAEIEAALDDVNLRRLIALFEELRKDSQLIVITHQKPTMDVANVLYGVTMRGDGVTRVISQRMAPEKTA